MVSTSFSLLIALSALVLVGCGSPPKTTASGYFQIGGGATFAENKVSLCGGTWFFEKAGSTRRSGDTSNCTQYYTLGEMVCTVDVRTGSAQVDKPGKRNDWQRNSQSWSKPRCKPIPLKLKQEIEKNKYIQLERR